MQRRTAGRTVSGLLAAAAIALLGLALWWLLDGGADAGSAGMPSALTAPHDDAPRPSFAAPARDAQVLDEDDDGDGVPSEPDPLPLTGADGTARAALTGRVTRLADGKPAAGVPVSAVIEIDGRRSKPPLDVDASQPFTGPDGRYRLLFTQDCTAVQLRARPGPTTVRGQRDSSLPLVLGEEATLDLQVGSGAAVSGLVVDTRGQPVPGAIVTASADTETMNFERVYDPDRTVQADGAGAFLLEGVGSPFVICAGAPGFTWRDMLVGTLAEGARLGAAAGGAAIEPPLTIVLSPVREIRGLVLGPDGKPVANARVSGAAPVPSLQERLTAVPDVFHLRWSVSERRTKADGGFTLSRVCGEPCTLSVWTNDYAPWEGTHAPGDPDLLIQLGKGLLLQGTVTAAGTGQLVPGAHVVVAWMDPMRQVTETHPGFSDGDGRFAISGLSRTQSAQVEASAGGYALFLTRPVAIAGPGPARVDIVLEPERPLGGVVVDGAGAPVPGAPVRIKRDTGPGGSADDADGAAGNELPGGSLEASFGIDRTETDAQGRFRFGQLGEGSFRIVANHPHDEQLAASAQARSGTEDLRLVLQPGATDSVTLVGTATDALTGRPLPSFTITPLVRSGGEFTGETHQVQDAEGRYRITGLPAGVLMITAQAPGHVGLSVPARDYEAGEQRVDLRFTESRSVTLRVLDALRRPVAAQLGFRGAGGAPLWVSAGEGSLISVLDTGPRGEAQAHGLPAEPIVVTVKPDVHGAGQDFPLDLRVAPRGPVELVLGGAVEATLFWVVVCAPSDFKEPEQEPWTSGLMASIEQQLAAGTLWLLDTDGRIRAADDSGAVKAEARLARGAPAGAAPPPANPSAPAVKSFLGSLKVTVVPLNITVEAEGYVPATRLFDAAADASSSKPLVFYLRRQ